MKTVFPLLIIFLVPLCCPAQTRESFSVYFDSDKYILTQNAAAKLDSFWRTNPQANLSAEFELSGFCDNRGTNLYNLSLSDKRVATVKNWLLKRGVNIESFMNTLGFGEDSSVNENKTGQERQLNRRVDIIIIKSGEASTPVNEKIITLKQKIGDSLTTAGTNIILHNINFAGGQHHLLPESQPMLDELLDAMRTYPKLVIRVEGHICCQPDEQDGLDIETGIPNLSEARAKAIRDYLLSNGVELKRVSYKGFGHSLPIYSYPEQSEDERIQNRRVEVKIISK